MPSDATTKIAPQQEEPLPPEVETLLKKYACGRMPPLVDVEDPSIGLIDVEWLKIYHSGMLATHRVSLGILLAAPDRSTLEAKWGEGNFALTEWSKKGWCPFCRTLRTTPEGNKLCEDCDRRWAVMAERTGGVIAYMCVGGLIDFAVPISVKGQVLAILFCGQLKPQAGHLWNSELLQDDGSFRALAAGEEGVDISPESQQRRKSAARKTDNLEGKLTESLSGSEWVSPQKVEELQAVLTRAAKQISALATSTYEIEKSKVVDRIRTHITSSLVSLGQGCPEVWKQLSVRLDYLAQYFGLDYALILSDGKDKEAREGVRVLSYTGLGEAKFRPGDRLPTDSQSLGPWKAAMSQLKEPTQLALRIYEDLPPFDLLWRLHRGRKSKQVLALPLPDYPVTTAAPILFVGRFRNDVNFSSFSSDDREALERIMHGVALVTEIILLVEQLREVSRKQDLFIEDVAHDIRTPIQNMIVEAEMLERTHILQEETKQLGQSLAGQARRLHIMSQRVWTLRNIAHGEFKANATELVTVYTALMECRKSLLDLAMKRDIKITVDRELEKWPPIRVNRTLFFQACLNLLDNAVKYSRKGSEVRVDGKKVSAASLFLKDTEPTTFSPPPGTKLAREGFVTLSYVNRGIPVLEAEKDKIFDRYYRSQAAQIHGPEGTGIGLSIVKAFVEHCEGHIEVNSTPVAGTKDYVTEFKIYIPLERQ